jgi:hypothetical protein
MFKSIKYTYSIVSIWLILINVWLLALTESTPEKVDPYLRYIALFDYFVLFVFSLEYIIKIITEKRKLKYLLSFDGIIDLVAILPPILGFFANLGVNTTWIRVLRLVRIARVVKALNYKSRLTGISAHILPYILLVFGIEAITFIAEAKGYWATPKDLNISLGVVGFSVAVMLGAKLTVVSSRIYSIEDAICRIVGSMRDMWQMQGIKKELNSWSLHLEDYITSSHEDKLTKAAAMRDKTDALEVAMEEHAVSAPNSAGFHRDAAFIIHRVTASIPEAYDNFLKAVICLYIFVIIVSVAGVPGLFASLLSVFILGGMYYLTEDMDKPLSFQKGSFINARIDALTYWNKKRAD